MVHGDAIANRDGINFTRQPTPTAHPILYCLSKRPQIDVSGNYLAKAVDYAPTKGLSQSSDEHPAVHSSDLWGARSIPFLTMSLRA